MEASLRPHRGGTVLVLGILSTAITFASLCLASQGFRFSFFCVVASVLVVPLGILAIVLGWRQATGMRANRIDPAGRPRVRTGQALAVAAVVLSVVLTTCMIVYFPADQMGLMDDGSRAVTKMRYGHVPEVQYYEVLGPKNTFVKQGPFVRWGHDGVKLEEGNYHEGKRLGEWTFRNEDGSIDRARSGYYANDVRVEEDAPSPSGDYPVRLPPAGYTQPR